jgi:hypothetical protein
MFDQATMYYLNKEHINDLQREASKARLVKLALEAAPPRPRAFSLPRLRLSWPSFANLLRRRNVAL